MVMRVVEVFEDDLDGSTADVTLSFAFDGTSYEIDLSNASAQRMREVIQPYVEAARIVTNTRSTRRAPSRGSGDSPAVVRQWARANGYEVNERGRIPAGLVAAYRAAHGG